MAKFANGTFHPNNTSKYVGKKFPQYRSSWEKTVMMWLDTSPAVISWGSEMIKIPYQHPVTGKICNYIPDLMVKYRDKTGNQYVECIEIKPKSQTIMEYARSKNDKLALAINQSKWHQAQLWCKSKGIVFRVMTEDQIFGISKKKKK